MGDSTDGSSIAAQSAHGQIDPMTSQTDAEPRGFFQKLFGAFGSPDTADNSDTLNEPDYVPAASNAHGMLNLRRMRMEDVAIPKADIVAVPSTITKDDLVAVFRESGLTRLPVFDGTLDTPIGMVHLKDFALSHGFNGTGKGRYSLSKLIRPVHFVPPSMPIGILLQKMQSDRMHMALVIDEYGGTDGLVTIEDLIEQVIGEIEDEHDATEGAFWKLESPGCYVALAKTPLDDFAAELGRSLTDHPDIDEEDIDTLGGLVFMLAGSVPVRGQVVQHPEGFEFEVVDAEPRRIKRLRVRTPEIAGE